MKTLENLLKNWFLESSSGLIESIYLSGSIIEDCAVKNSDIDICLVTSIPKNELIEELISRLISTVESQQKKEAGILLLHKEQIQGTAIPRYLKEAKLVHGFDHFSLLAQMSPEQTYERWTKGSARLLGLMLDRWSTELNQAFASNDGFIEMLDQETGERETKLLVNLVARIIGARLALESSYVPKSKSDCFKKFEMIAKEDELAFSHDFLTTIKFDWNYRAPKSAGELEKLRSLLIQMVDFIVGSFKFMKQEQKNISFVDDKVVDELDQLLTNAEDRLREELQHL